MQSMTLPNENDRPLEGALERRRCDAWRGYFTASDGTELFFIRWTTPQGEDNQGPVIVLVHGYGEHIERYHEVGTALAETGYPVCGMDCRGHGQSQGKRGHVDRFEEYIDDLRIYAQWVQARYPQRPLVLLGHSNGGLISIRTVETYPDLFQAMILTGPLLGLSLDVPAWKRALGLMLSKYLPKLAMGNEIPPEDVTRDKEIARRYARDPRVHHVATARYFTEMLAAMDKARREVFKINIPTLIFQGGADRIVKVSATRRFAQVLKKGEYRELPGFYHEVLNEPERDEIFKAIIDWLKKTFEDHHAS